MTISELHQTLQNLGIPEDWYHLHGIYGSTNDDERLGLNIRAGKYYQEFEVYYKERGSKHSIRTFTSEGDACNYILKTLKERKEFEDTGRFSA